MLARKYEDLRNRTTAFSLQSEGSTTLRIECFPFHHFLPIHQILWQNGEIENRIEGKGEGESSGSAFIKLAGIAEGKYLIVGNFWILNSMSLRILPENPGLEFLEFNRQAKSKEAQIKEIRRRSI